MARNAGPSTSRAAARHSLSAATGQSRLSAGTRCVRPTACRSLLLRGKYNAIPCAGTSVACSNRRVSSSRLGSLSNPNRISARSRWVRSAAAASPYASAAAAALSIQAFSAARSRSCSGSARRSWTLWTANSFQGLPHQDMAGWIRKAVGVVPMCEGRWAAGQGVKRRRLTVRGKTLRDPLWRRRKKTTPCLFEMPHTGRVTLLGILARH